MDRILIVEDNLITSMHLELMLIRQGHSVIGKLTYAEDVKDFVLEKNASLIFMDVMLDGDMTGIDAAVEVREHKAVPIIFLTALTDSNTRKKIEKLDNTYIISKPFDNAKIEEIIGSISVVS